MYRLCLYMTLTWLTVSFSLKLCTSDIGARVCVLLLNSMVKLYDAEDASDGARAFDVG